MRQIKPYKGGRTERIYIRATPETKRLFLKIQKETGKSASDIFEEAIEEKKAGVFVLEKKEEGFFDE